ncbi:unnamed protein product [Aspergillus oryzae]|uniref:Unnamed protein product n=1 Tax=Aspergillus oryzae TaxID=5062 RepID=A0AAN4YJ34_ASPOZ|nr:unnamed protein product [Aspergillus oryzae]GMF91925.1 unnamed protein product [Aspergillus oryzae]GMG27929.1 unnamed protein product [Aspergillus oryzae]
MLSFSSQSVGAEDSLSTIRLPDASVDPELLADDIVQLAARGAGEIEFLNYSTTAALLGEVPGWGKGDLVSAVTFAVLNTTTVTQPPPQPQTPLPLSPNDVSESLFSLESLTELTDSISQDGKMTVNVSSVKEATSYMLYASYARRSYARACTASSENHQNILQNGSFAVDHFSVMGAKVTTSFLKEYILIDRIQRAHGGDWKLCLGGQR